MIPRSVLKSEAKFMSKIKLSDSLREKRSYYFGFSRDKTEKIQNAVCQLYGRYEFTKRDFME